MNNEIKFEIVSSYEDKIDSSFIPKRGTKASVGYDILAADDIVIPSFFETLNDFYMNEDEITELHGHSPYTLNEIDSIIKEYGERLTLVPTGIKAKFPEGVCLSIRARSSMPYKHFLLIANQPAVIECDYYNNPDNEGHIYVQFINLSPFNIQIKKGDKIAQFVFEPYFKVTDDEEVEKSRQGGFGSTGK